MNLDAWDYETLVSAATERLRVQTEAHRVWGLGRFDRWDLDQDDGTVTFTDPTRGTATAPAQIAGNLDVESGTWLWAWANPTVHQPLAGSSEEARSFGDRRGFERLTTPQWRATESDGWTMAALTSLISGSQGAYRGPIPGGFVFITFGEVKLLPPGRRASSPGRRPPARGR